MLITLPYDNKLYFSNPFCSRTRNITNELSFIWEGTLEISPNFDHWIDTEVLPVVIEKQKNTSSWLLSNENGLTPFNAHHSSWNTIARGISPEINISTENNTTIKTDIDQHQLINHTTIARQALALREQVQVQTQQQQQQHTLFVPYIRSRKVTLSAKHLKGNTRFYLFFDNIDITPFELISSSTGELTFEFTIPPKLFLAGNKLVQLSNDSLNRADYITSFATAEYTANGLISQNTRSITSTEHPKELTESQIEQRTQLNTHRRGPRPLVNEPLAYTFVIEKTSGAFLTKLELFFFKKSSANLGINISIRNVENEKPGSLIVPFSEKYIESKDVNISNDGTVPTTIIFDNPIYLQDQQQYAICITADRSNLEYELWTSEIGSNDINTRSKIVELPGSGSVFTGAQNRQWTRHIMEDFKCNIFIAKFDINNNRTLMFESEKIDWIEYAGMPLLELKSSVLGDFHITLDRALTQQTTNISSSIFGENSKITGILNNNKTIRVSNNERVSLESVISINNEEYAIESIEQAKGLIEEFGTNELVLTESNGLFYEGEIINNTRVITKIKNYSISLLHTRIAELNFPGTSIHWSSEINGIRHTIASNRDEEINNENILYSVSNKSTNATALKLFSILSSNNENVSPIIDTDKVYSLLIRHNINNVNNKEVLKRSEEYDSSSLQTLVTLSHEYTLVDNEIININNGEEQLIVHSVLNEYQFIVSSLLHNIKIGDQINNTDITIKNLQKIERAECRYFTKPIELSLEAEDLMIYLTASIPRNTSVHVFFKVQHSDDRFRSFEQIKWRWITELESNGGVEQEYSCTPLIEDRENNSSSPMFNAVKYDGYTGFIRFAIKLILLSDDRINIPKVKNLRGIALML